MNKLIKDVSGWCLILVLFSCTSAPKHLAKAIEKDKPYVAEQTRLLFPCTDIKADTVTVTDSLYEFVECPEQNEYISRIDTVQIEGKTVYVPITKTVKTPVKVARETKYVTVKVEDSAKIYLMGKYLDEAAEAMDKAKAELEKRRAKIDKQKKAIRILLIPWILAVLYVVYRIVIKRK